MALEPSNGSSVEQLALNGLSRFNSACHKARQKSASLSFQIRRRVDGGKHNQADSTSDALGDRAQGISVF